MAKHSRSLAWLAAKDYAAEWQMSGFAVLSLAAVLGPMMILFGLKFGIIGSMVEKLVNNPHNLEIRSIGSGRYTEAWLKDMQQRDDISFIAAEQPSIASTLRIKGQSPKIIEVRFIASGEGDPLLEGLPAPRGTDIILSTQAAKKLGVRVGHSISGSIARQIRGKKQREHIPLQIVGIAPETASDRITAFVDPTLSNQISAFKNGNQVVEMGWLGGRIDQKETVYSGFRLYARSLYDLDSLQTMFEQQGIDIRTRSREAALVRSMDQNLSTIYWVVAAIGLFGYGLSLAASLWSNVDRKRRDLSVLRVIGFRTGDITRFPIIQAMFTALLGWLTASLIYLGVSSLINHLLSDQLRAGETVVNLEPMHFLSALGITLIVAILAAALAGYRASRIEPADGLREL